MNGHERLLASLAHCEPDQFPVDFGSTAVTGIHASCIAALRNHFGLDPHPVRIIEPYQMLGLVEPDLLDALGIDTCSVLPPKNLFGFENKDWKSWRAPWGQELEVPGGFMTSPAPDGGALIYPEGDTSVPASGHMPARGYFFDTIVRQEPFDEDALNLEDNLEEFGPVTDADLVHFRETSAALAKTGRAVVATFGGTAFGDIALVPGPFMKRPRGIRDIEEWYVSVATRGDFVKQIFERQCEIALGNLEKIARATGDAVDVVFLCGTDFGTQISQFCSVDTFDDLWKPFYRAVNDWIHTNTRWKTFKHSCGAIRPLLPEMIAAGFDIINPVQCSATGMEPRALKADFGSRLTFWGGGVDTQKTLPFGTPEQVRTEVLERCEIFAPDGGFVFNSIHNLQARTPVENLVAMFEAVREFNGAKV
jgi:hypothetical protein